jgi:hypothetical protein
MEHCLAGVVIWVLEVDIVIQSMDNVLVGDLILLVVSVCSVALDIMLSLSVDVRMLCSLLLVWCVMVSWYGIR